MAEARGGEESRRGWGGLWWTSSSRWGGGDRNHSLDLFQTILALCLPWYPPCLLPLFVVIMGWETLKNKSRPSCLLVLVTGFGGKMGASLFPLQTRSPWIQPGFLPWLRGLCPLVLVFQLQTKAFPGRGSVFLANRMLSADRRTVRTKRAALLCWGQEDESPPPAAGTRSLGSSQQCPGLLQCGILQGLFSGIHLRPWWLISPLITTGEETAS